MITFAALNSLTNIRHAFFTKHGGVSTGVYDSLNCGYGSGDAPENVTRNRRIALERLGVTDWPLVTAYQEHTAHVVTVAEPWEPDDAPVADGLVTDRPGLILGILSADCAPVMLADPDAGVVGAAHAGWRGARAGILEATMSAMSGLGADPANTFAAIGPCIAQRSYEVTDEFAGPILEEDERNADLFAPGRRDGHPMFDLPGYVGRRLNDMKLRHVVRSPCDTCRESDRFFSYRRSVLNDEPDYGRGLSVVTLHE